MSTSLDKRSVYVVIPAAGSGRRMGASRNKQFLEVGGLPLIIRTLITFEQNTRITGIVVVTAQEDQEAMAALIAQYDFKKFLAFAIGGDTRQASVLAGLQKIATMVHDLSESIALVHDGARCFINTEVIDRCIDGIITHDAACGVAVPVKDTIKLVQHDGKVEKTLNRNTLFAMQTPQGAPFTDLLEGYRQLEKTGQHVTDDLAVMEAIGRPTYLVSGDYTNIKMTTPEDLVIGEALAGSV
ncbi:MAG: 2-C-methyl-D-erythritol 4-phosphate cytidylyltransferase [Eubacteriales bacterium]|nr:2-C-methyl-D-erythritol 4-phosphate cytidylyltransferase [Eubacteriales bacterium]